MTDIVPGILATTAREFKEQLHLLKFAKKIHLDVMDGKFVPNKTVGLSVLKKLFPDKEVQVHLMAHKPHKYIAPFSRLGARELIVHAEATEHACETLEDIRGAGMKSGIAFNPKTHVADHADALIHADSALVMTVQPGYSGQTFLKQPLGKITTIRKYNPLISIGVDGGVNLSTCKMVKPANFAIATSAIQTADEPRQAWKQLTRIVSPRI